MELKWICVGRSLVLWILLDVTICNGRHYHGFSQEDRLIKHLLNRYEQRTTYGRPVLNFSEAVHVQFGIQLIQIMDLDERNQILTLNVWTGYNWTDIHLQWNKTEYHGVDSVCISSDKIWTPDIKLYNYADERLNELRDARCVISHTGEVTWLPQAVLKSSCDIDVRAFPFDKQTCKLKFGSWSYGGNRLDLYFKDGKNRMIMADYKESNVWQVLEVPAIKNVRTYDCCPEPFVDLTFTLVIRRKATFYAYTLILPCVLLTSLTLVLFWIPPESPAKMTLGMSIFMAYFVLLLMFESNLPPAATSLPILGTYYCLNMILITMSSFLCVFVVNMTVTGARGAGRIPYTLKKVMFSYVARVLCMGKLVQPFIDDVHISCPSRYVGVNGDGSKFANDWKGSNEVLVSVQKDGTELALIHSKVNEIRNFIKMYKERLEEKDRKDKVAKEWRALAIVFDRIFFIIYFTTIIASLCVVLSIIFHS